MIQKTWKISVLEEGEMEITATDQKIGQKERGTL